MTTRTADRVDDWESRPFSGGYEELRSLADASFSGVVTAGRATACLLNGAVVGILDGTIEDFEDASGTIREAPTPALPLLIVMQERADEVRARYYSEETPLSSANKKLSDGGFTGFIELSENILSGDYFVVYHGGRSMSVAYVGESQKLLTDDEAFQTADDEVGIYKVYPVDIEPIDIPEPEDTSVAAVGTAADGDEPETSDEPEASAEDTQADEAVTESTAADHQDATVATDDPVTEESTTEPVTEEPPTESVAEETAAEASAESETPVTESTPGDGTRSETADPPATEPDQSDPASEGQTGPEEPSSSDRRSTVRDSIDRTQDQRAESQPTAREEPEPTGSEHRSQRPRQEETVGETQHRESPSSDPLADPTEGATGGSGDLERRSIPSLDPEKTWRADEDDPSTDTRTAVQPRQVETERPGSENASQVERGQSNRRGGQSGHRRDQPQQRSEELITELRETEAEVERLEQELTTLENERAELAETNSELESQLQQARTERDDLQATVQQLRSEVADLEARLESAEESAPTGADVTLNAAEAIDQTNLFVRYGSKGEATLKAAHGGGAEKDAVNDNLDLEYHTQFDADSAAVAGQPFGEFLRSTIQYQFVNWVVHDLLYEIRDTGHAKALQDLFDALPNLDRAELNGAVSVQFTENGEQHRTQIGFDIVLRDRMGNPLVVANINDSREAATEGMMSSLVTDATKVGESADTLAGAFLVTSSFFDPEALETAAEATGGGLLSRDKRESFVRLSRKQGYHLCLVEARDEKFHLAVPEL